MSRGRAGQRIDRPSGTAVRLVAFDLDGVLWRGGQVLPWAREALEDVLRRGLDLRYVSNNSTAHRETVSDRLASLGLPSGAERVLTSAFATGRWLRERVPPGSPVMVVGEEGLLRELQEAGLAAYRAGDDAPDDQVVDGGAPAIPAAVVVGMDRAFTYRTLAEAQRAVLAGARFVATNRDATFPTPDGLAPGAGAIVAAVATATRQEPVLMGKPGPALAETLAAVAGVPSGQTLFVGDRMSTDIAMGREAGMTTVLVLTGVTSAADLELYRSEGRGPLPDHVLTDLGGLPDLLTSLGV